MNRYIVPLSLALCLAPVVSYAQHPPGEVNGIAVTATRNFAEDEIRDIEGQLLPKEKMLSIELADGRRVAIRPSGTEPKIKFYMFARRDPAPGARFSTTELATIKADVGASLGALWSWIQKDVEQRLA